MRVENIQLRNMTEQQSAVSHFGATKQLYDRICGFNEMFHYHEFEKA
ncbi:MAG: hypothetical protein LBK94_09550 [Prevotellaceae bacterium]|jgi:hypothetical protein|nr:hypothetical protein [Prevotellaceae bacterium]